MSTEVRRYPGESPLQCTQRILDAFYTEHGPCCAGCDWWNPHNSVVGDCERYAPVPGEQRVAMLGMRLAGHSPAAGHVMTLREHHCGDFKDEFEWSSLPLLYLRRIGRTA